MTTTTFAKAKRIAAFLNLIGLAGAVKLLTGPLFNREMTDVPAGVDDSKLDEYYFVVATDQAPAVSCADFIQKFSSNQRIMQLRQLHETGLVGKGLDFNVWLLSLEPINTAVEKTLARLV